jgi:hypothetical protein
MRRVQVALALFVLSIVTRTSHADVMAQGTITRLDSSTSAAGTFVIEVDGPGGLCLQRESAGDRCRQFS